ncbi:MAG TPA: RidA family protein [Amycolatopsis sp.]|jgi:reactive intermediate/imine deaminase
MSTPDSPEFFPMPHGLPFSRAVRIGDLYYLSGQIGLDDEGRLVPGFAAQARQAMHNIAGALDAVGLGMEHVVKCTVTLRDIALWAEFNEIYLTFFDSRRLPVRTAFGSVALALDADVEVEAWACRAVPAASSRG